MELVDDRPEPERIEIELISNVEDHERWRHGHSHDGGGDSGDELVTSPSEASMGTAAGGQLRLFATAAIVGVVALLLGWLIGRSGGADEVATSNATAPVTTEPPATTLAAGEPLPPVEEVTTTRPRRTTTTTTLSPPSIESVAIDPRLVGVDLRLVGSEQSRILVELDLAEQTLTRQDVGRSFESGAMFVGEDWVALLSPGGGTTRLLRDGDPPQLVELGEPWELLWQEDADRFWRPNYEFESFNGPSLYEEFDITGEPTGVTLELPIGTWVQQTDPKGGLIVERVGKYYTISESGISLIGTGEMIGLSADIAVFRDCDEQLRCGLFVTDRQTGAVRGLELVPLRDELVAIEPMYGWGPPGHGRMISPDGTMVAVMLPSLEAPLLGLIDLTSGAVVELGETWWMPAVVWSPDGRFAFFLDGREGSGGSDLRSLSVYDRESGAVFPVSSEPLAWESLVGRPTGSS